MSVLLELHSAATCPSGQRASSGPTCDASSLPQGGGYRYTVAVEQGSGKGPKRRQQQQQGPRTFGLREADDGWERIEVGRPA